jgi:hypothetical protein
MVDAVLMRSKEVRMASPDRSISKDPAQPGVSCPNAPVESDNVTNVGGRQIGGSSAFCSVRTDERTASPPEGASCGPRKHPTVCISGPTKVSGWRPA